MCEGSVDKECGKIKNYPLQDEKRTVLCVYFISFRWYDEDSYKGGRILKEICAKTNPLGLRVFVNGEPEFSQMEATELSLMASTLELAISQEFDDYMKRKGNRGME